MDDHLSNFARYFTIQSSCSYIFMIWQWQFSITTSDGLLLDMTVYHCLSLHQQWMLVDKWWPKFGMSIQFQQHCGAGQLSCVAASGPRASHNLASGPSGKHRLSSQIGAIPGRNFKGESWLKALWLNFFFEHQTLQDRRWTPTNPRPP